MQSAGKYATTKIDRDVHLAPAVDVHHVGLDLKSILGMTDVLDENRRALGHSQWEVVDLLHRRGHTVSDDEVIQGADLGVACWDQRVPLAKCLSHIQRRHAARSELHGIDVDIDAADATAKHGWRNRAADSAEHIADTEIGHP